MKAILFGLFIATCVMTSRVSVDAYTESQCPGCKQFVSNSLKQAIYTQDIEKIVDIRLISYGNAHRTRNSDGTYSFQCQHGAVECFGNTVILCGQNRVQGQLDKLKYTVCIEENSGSSQQSFIDASAKCAKQFNVNHDSVMQCAQSAEGNGYHAAAAQETENLVPAHKWVPWVVGNKSYTDDSANRIQSNLVQWACQNYQGPDRIAACAQYLVAIE